MILEGVYRRWSGLRAGKGAIDARLTHQESLATAQIEPSGFEMTRAARRFMIAFNNATLPTGIAPIQTLPAAAYHWAISNRDTTKTYFFQSIGMFPLSGTPGIGGIVFGCIDYIVATTAAAGAFVASASKISANGTAPINPGSNALIQSNAATVNVPAWFPIAFNQPGSVGAGIAGNAIINTEIQGRIALQPGLSLRLVTVALAGTTPLFLPIAEWIEQETDME